MSRIERLEIINSLKGRYAGWLNTEIESINFCRSRKAVFLEMRLSNQPGTQIVDLSFIGSDDYTGSMFLPEADIVDNAMEFLRLDTYTLLMCVDDLFTKEAEVLIEAENMENRRNLGD